MGKTQKDKLLDLENSSKIYCIVLLPEKRKHNFDWIVQKAIIKFVEIA